VQLMIKKIFSSFLVILVILTGIPGIFYYPAEKILFSPVNYKKALSDVRMYDQIPALILDWINQQKKIPGNEVQTKILSYLTPADYKDLLTALIPPDWYQRQAEGIFDQGWAYVFGQSNIIHLNLDLKQIKSKLAGDFSLMVTQRILKALPRCTDADINKIAAIILGGSNQAMPICKPPDQLTSLAEQFIQVGVQSAAGLIPDQVDLAVTLTPVGQKPIKTSDPQYYIDIFDQMRAIWRLLPVISLGILLLLGLLAIKTARGIFLWTGIPVLVTGLSALGIAWWLSISSGTYVTHFLNNFKFIPPSLLAPLVEAFLRVESPFIVLSGSIALICSAAGFFTIILGLLIRRPETA
jgi:hypothetical protein